MDKLGLVLVVLEWGSCFEFSYMKVGEGRTGPADVGNAKILPFTQHKATDTAASHSGSPRTDVWS